jgi:hypothetical protein
MDDVFPCTIMHFVTMHRAVFISHHDRPNNVGSDLLVLVSYTKKLILFSERITSVLYTTVLYYVNDLNNEDYSLLEQDAV